MIKSNRTLMEYLTPLAPSDVIEQAKSFFSGRQAIYSAFLEKEGPGWATFRGQGGEEIAIAATAATSGTRVTGSTYLFDMQIARFFATLPESLGDNASIPATNAAAHPAVTP
jgi:hypothetical protein